MSRYDQLKEHSADTMPPWCRRSTPLKAIAYQISPLLSALYVIRAVFYPYRSSNPQLNHRKEDIKLSAGEARRPRWPRQSFPSTGLPVPSPVPRDFGLVCAPGIHQASGSWAHAGWAGENDQGNAGLLNGHEKPNFTADQEFGTAFQHLLLWQNPPGQGEQEKRGPREIWPSRLLCSSLAAGSCSWTSLYCRVQRGTVSPVIVFFGEAVTRLKWTNSCKMFITMISKCGMRIYYNYCVEGWITTRLFGGQGIREQWFEEESHSISICFWAVCHAEREPPLPRTVKLFSYILI